MKYRELLDKIYTSYKKNNIYVVDSYIKFYKENNTNIVNFEINDPKLSMINGIIVEQNHLVSIYFKIKENSDIYSFYSKTNIIIENRAIIYNFLLKNSQLIENETIGHDFYKRVDLYKFNSSDCIMNDNIFDTNFENIIEEISIQNEQKNKQKGLKI